MKIFGKKKAQTLASVPPLPEGLPIREQIKRLREQLEVLEAEEFKTIVAELELTPAKFAETQKERYAARWPYVQKEVTRELRAQVWSGEKVARIVPSTRIYNDKIVKWLGGLGFKATVEALGAG